MTGSPPVWYAEAMNDQQRQKLLSKRQEDYKRRQALIDEIAREFIASRPDWEVRQPHVEGQRRRSGAAVAAANIRRLIKEIWPKCQAQVRVEDGGVIVNVLALPDHPAAHAVRSQLDYFVDRRWDSQSETYQFNDDEEQEGWRRAFGSCNRIRVNETTPTPAQLAKHMSKSLPTPAAPGRRARM